MSKLIITEDGQDKIYEIVDESFTIGGGPEADLQLRSAGASPVHVTVKKAKTGYRLIDMETKIGTLVNGKPVNEHVLTNGDTIEVDDVKITYIGKGPARSQAAPGRRASRPKVESKYRHSDRKSGFTAGQSIALLGGAIAFLGVIFWFMLSSETPKDKKLLEIKDAMNDFQEGREDPASVSTRIAKLERMDLERHHRKKLAELKKMVAERREMDKVRGAETEAKAAWVQIHNKRLHAPDDVLALKALCDEYLANYGGLKTRHEGQVRDLVAELTEAGSISPERAKLGELQAKVHELRKQKELRLAFEAIQDFDPDVKALYSEEIDDMATSLRKKSRQYLGVRKNDVRHELRLNNEAGAREMFRDRCLDKLVYSVMEDYLEFPDKGYRNPDVARLELETQKLMREEMDLWLKAHKRAKR